MAKFDRYTANARLAMSYARDEAQRLRHRLVGPEHILLGMLKLHDPLIEGLFNALHVSPESIVQALDFVVGRGSKAILSEPTFSVGARAVLARAEEKALHRQAQLVGLEHLFTALLEEHNGIAVGVLESFGVQIDMARQQLATMANGGLERLNITAQLYARYEKTPILNQVSHDLTLAALQDTIDPLIGRSVELDRMIQILCRRSKNNPVLIGPAGVGKTAIAEGLALRIVQGTVPAQLLRCRVVALDVGLLSVGTRFRGDFEERLKRILREVCTSSGLLVFIDELHTLVQTGVADGSIDAANLFKPMLARREFQCIGATTLDEYRKTIEADPALERRFQPVFVSETNDADTLSILQGLRSKYEAFHGVLISDEALEVAVEMSTRYIRGRFQPDNALDLIDEAAARVRVQSWVKPPEIQQAHHSIAVLQREKEEAIQQHDFARAASLFRQERQLRQDAWEKEYTWQKIDRQQHLLVEKQDIAMIVSMRTGLPVTKLTHEDSLRLLHLEEQLHHRVVGQDTAVHALAQAVRRAHTRMRDPHRPIGSFVFAGPTGVGKTELALALTEALFGDEKALIRFDMSEFMESHSVARLVGSPPGYIGYDQAGQLTEAVKRRPYCVILFDEIEKAHPRMFDLLLQVLDEGRLTDARGRMVDFRHTIILLTSNIGGSFSQTGSMAFCNSGEQTREKREIQIYEQRAHKALQELFRPELLNRLDETIIFHPLDIYHLRAIVDRFLERTTQRLVQKSMSLTVTETARTFLAEQGRHTEYGARHLRRVVQSMVDDMLAELLLCGKCKEGAHILIDLSDQRCLTVDIQNSESCHMDYKLHENNNVAA